MVEETINGKALWNQPAGHLEADETLVQAAERELWEETGIRATPQAFLRLHQWIAPDRTPFLRFCFVIELEQPLPTEPHDSDIDRCLWLSADEILQAPNLRSALVAESIRSYQQPGATRCHWSAASPGRFKGAGQHKMNSAPARPTW